MMREMIRSAIRTLVPVSLLLGAIILISAEPTVAQSYSSGQPLWAAYEGWERADDGGFDMLFGYMNDNWEEEIDIPIGADNNIQPGGTDQGQPTHFLPRRNRFMFRVRVPKDFGDKEMIWTLTRRGKTSKAYGTLRTDYLIENIDIMSETGALGPGISDPVLRGDKPPTIKVEGEKTRRVKVGEPLALAALVTDDGLPRARGQAPPPAPGGGARGGPPPQAGAGAAGPPPGVARGPAFFPPTRLTVGKALGLHVSWFVYRGAGKVTFEPQQVKVWEDTRAGTNSPWAPLWTPPQLPPDGRWTAQVTFDSPGTYVLRARADDGALTGDDQLAVTVTR
jgi:hypothetical protein